MVLENRVSVDPPKADESALVEDEERVEVAEPELREWVNWSKRYAPYLNRYNQFKYGKGVEASEVIAVVPTLGYSDHDLNVQPKGDFEKKIAFEGQKSLPAMQIRGDIQMKPEGKTNLEFFVPIYSTSGIPVHVECFLDDVLILERNDYEAGESPFYGLRTNFELGAEKVKKEGSHLEMRVYFGGFT